MLTATSLKAGRIGSGVSVLTMMVDSALPSLAYPIESSSARVSCPSPSFDPVSSFKCWVPSKNWGRVVSLLRFLEFDCDGGDDGGVDGGSAGSEEGRTDVASLSELGGRGLKYANMDPRFGFGAWP